MKCQYFQPYRLAFQLPRSHAGLPCKCYRDQKSKKQRKAWSEALHDMVDMGRNPSGMARHFDLHEGFMADDHLPIKANHLPEMECNYDRNQAIKLLNRLCQGIIIVIFRTAQYN